MLSWQFIILFHSRNVLTLMINDFRHFENDGVYWYSQRLSLSLSLHVPFLRHLLIFINDFLRVECVWGSLIGPFLLVNCLQDGVGTPQTGDQQFTRPMAHKTSLKMLSLKAHEIDTRAPPPPPTSRRHHIILFRSFACGQLLRDYHESTALYWGPYNQYYSRIARYPFNTSGSRGRWVKHFAHGCKHRAMIEPGPLKRGGGGGKLKLSLLLSHFSQYFHEVLTKIIKDVHHHKTDKSHVNNVHGFSLIPTHDCQTWSIFFYRAQWTWTIQLNKHRRW